MPRIERLKDKQAGFQKLSHRPWDKECLEKIISEDNENKEFIGNIPADEEPLEKLDQEKTACTIITPVDSTNPKNNTVKLEETNIEIIRRQIEDKLLNRQQQQQSILENLGSKSNSQITLGGFFQPNSVLYNAGNEHGKRVSQLIGNLADVEKDILILKNNINTTEALEKTEKAELAMRLSQKAKEIADRKANDAILHAHDVAKKMNDSLERMAKAEKQSVEERKMRKEAEEKERLAYIEANKFNLFKETALEDKKAAEEKMQHAINQTVNAEMARQESQELRKKFEEEMEYSRKLANKAEQDKNTAIAKAKQDETELKNQLKDLKNQVQKLKDDFIHAENKLISTTAKKEELTDSIAILNKNLQEKTNQLQDLTNQLQESKNNCSRTEDKLITTTEQKEESMNSVTTLNKTLQEKNNQLQDLTNQLQELKNNFSRTEDKLIATTKQKEESMNSVTTLNKTLQEKNNQLQDLTNQLQESKNNFRHTEDKLIASIEEKEKLMNSITTLNKDLQDKNNLLVDYKDLQNKVEKTTLLIETERKLRQLSEHKTKETKDELAKLNIAYEKEKNDRKSAEQKAKMAIQQAHKTMLDFLGPSTENN